MKIIELDGKTLEIIQYVESGRQYLVCLEKRRFRRLMHGFLDAARLLFGVESVYVSRRGEKTHIAIDVPGGALYM